MKIFTVVLALFFLAAVPVLAETNVGGALPHSLAAYDQNKVLQNFETLKGENGAVLVFVRSAGWCSYCQKQLLDLAIAKEDIEATGYNIVSVSYDSTDILAAFTKKHGIPYVMLSDPDSEIIKSFGILNEDMKEGTQYYGIPHPGIYIVSVDGIVQTKLLEEGYKKRPAPAIIIETIQQLNK